MDSPRVKLASRVKCRSRGDRWLSRAACRVTLAWRSRAMYLCNVKWTKVIAYAYDAWRVTLAWRSRPMCFRLKTPISGDGFGVPWSRIWSHSLRRICRIKCCILQTILFTWHIRPGNKTSLIFFAAFIFLWFCCIFSWDQYAIITSYKYIFQNWHVNISCPFKSLSFGIKWVFKHCI